MTLLSPAVLHCSALEHIKDETTAFHKSYIFKFGLLQGVWGVILYLLCVATIVFPRVQTLRETGDKILTNANFSTVRITNGSMHTDIKPAIWTFTINDSSSVKTDFAIDSTGKMNRFYWDDRVEKGEVKQINGMAFMREYIFLKRGTVIRKIPYTQFVRGGNGEFTKEQIYNNFMKYTEKRGVLKLALAAIPVVFLFTMVAGVLAHIVYILVVGSLLVIFTQRFTRVAQSCYKIASGLYVGWFYVAALLMVTHRIVYATLANLSSFYIAIESILFVTIVFVGYLCIHTAEQMKTTVITNPIPKIKRKGA